MRFLCLLLSMLLSCPLLGQDTLFFDGSPVMQAERYFYIWKEGSQPLDIQQVASMPAQSFTPLSDSLKAGKLPAGNYWVTFCLNGAMPQEAVLSLGAVDDATLYQQVASGTWAQYRGGAYVPQSQKSLPIRGVWTANLLFNAQGGGQRLYMRWEQHSKSPIQLDANLKSSLQWKADYQESVANFRLILGGVLGFLGIMFLYNLLTGIFSRERVFLYYSIYILGGIIYMVNYIGLLSNTIVGESPMLGMMIRNISPCIGFIGYMLFMKSFLNTKANYPFWDKVSSFIIGIMLCSTLLMLTVLPFSFNEAYTRRPGAFGHLISQSFMLVFIVKLFFGKDKIAYYFAIGSSMFVGAGIFLGYVVGTNKLPLEVGLSVEFMGIAGELIAFSLGLGYKIKLAEKEKRLAQEETARLLKHQNEVLEERVKERTMALELKQEEIMTQNEELQQQQEEIISQRDYIELQHRDLVNKNEKITDSIRYAQTIQNTILPFPERLAKGLGEYFVCYKPKDIVSGDFYWYEEVGDVKLLAVLDCTGHGVPGGFMSMMGFSILNDIAIKGYASRPSEILDRLNDTLLRMLRQDSGTEVISDGMDVALCAIAPAQDGMVKVDFCGAKRPLYYVLPTEPGMHEIPGDRKSIGGHQVEGKFFLDRQLLLPKGSTLYLCTDGWADQHDRKGMKYGSARFKKLLEEGASLPLAQQAERLEEEWVRHTQNQHQRDDVTIVGVRI